LTRTATHTAGDVFAFDVGDDVWVRLTDGIPHFNDLVIDERRVFAVPFNQLYTPD
jgi:hypothetical protein